MDAMTAPPPADELGQFLRRNLSKMNFAQGFAWFHYRPQNTIREVLAPNFFGAVSGLVVPGDLITATCADGKVEFLVVVADGLGQVETAITSSLVLQSHNPARD